MTDALTPANIFKLGFGFWESKTLLSAVELGLFTELAKGPAYLGDLEQSEPSPLPAGLPRPGSPVFLTRHSGRARLKVTYDTLVFLKYF